MPEKPLDKDTPGQHIGLIKSKTIGLLLVAFLLVKVFLALFFPESRLTLASDLTPENILKAVNEQRSLRNLVTLNTNSKLVWAAQSKSDDMQARHYFAHVDPDGHYIWDKIVAAGYSPYLELGENLAIEFYDTDSLISAWMNSPEHRANLLNDGFQDQGMGLAFGDSSLGQYHSAITNTFGTLAPAPKAKAAPPPGLSMPAPAPAPAAQPPAKEPAAPAPKQIVSGGQKTAPSSTPIAVSQAAAPAASTTLPEPILIREGQLPAQNNPRSNFSVSSQPANEASTTTSTPAAAPLQPPLAVVGKPQSAGLAGYQTNRYLILFAGFILLMLMLSDIRTALRNKFANLDKKFNNIFLLIVSLVVIAFMYWL